MFVCQLKLAGDNFPSIKRKFQERFGKLAPCRSAMKGRVVKLNTKFTVWNLMKENSEWSKEDCEDTEMIASVKKRASLMVIQIEVCYCSMRSGANC